MNEVFMGESPYPQQLCAEIKRLQAEVKRLEQQQQQQAQMDMDTTPATEVKVRSCFPFSNDTLSNVDLMIQVEPVFNYVVAANTRDHMWRCTKDHPRNTYADKKSAKRHFINTGHHIFDQYKPQSSNQEDVRTSVASVRSHLQNPQAP